jgi:hypothetical protein
VLSSHLTAYFQRLFSPLTLLGQEPFFVIAHDRRRILHCNATPNPQAFWVAVQLCETWEEGKSPQRFLLFDRDSKFSSDVVSSVKAMGSQPVRTGVHYHHADRTHLGLRKDTPLGRIAESTPPSENRVISLPRLGGLHHRYAVAA